MRNSQSQAQNTGFLAPALHRRCEQRSFSSSPRPTLCWSWAGWGWPRGGLRLGLGQALMEIGPFSWGGNEKQMWLRSWGADSCRVRGLRLHEGTCDCGYRNCLKPQSWGLTWAWEAKLPSPTLDFQISLSLLEPVEQEVRRECSGAGQDPSCCG